MNPEKISYPLSSDRQRSVQELQRMMLHGIIPPQLTEQNIPQYAPTVIEFIERSKEADHVAMEQSGFYTGEPLPIMAGSRGSEHHLLGTVSWMESLTFNQGYNNDSPPHFEQSPQVVAVIKSILTGTIYQGARVFQFPHITRVDQNRSENDSDHVRKRYPHRLYDSLWIDTHHWYFGDLKNPHARKCTCIIYPEDLQITVTQDERLNPREGFFTYHEVRTERQVNQETFVIQATHEGGILIECQARKTTCNPNGEIQSVIGAQILPNPVFTHFTREEGLYYYFPFPRKFNAYEGIVGNKSSDFQHIPGYFSPDALFPPQDQVYPIESLVFTP